jgi:hypothetical protein
MRSYANAANDGITIDHDELIKSWKAEKPRKG